ncbi:MAG: segregation/condensation protein A [Spirochaetales bacterium]
MEDQQGGVVQRFQIGEFEGPLDLLLFLIKKNEINIYDIPISQITEQYLEYLQYAERVDLENITEFYLMAATLLYIKSRMLLPVEVDFGDEYEDPRKELVEKLIEYQKIKKLSELIGHRGAESEWLLERKNRQRVLPFSDDELWQQISVWDLFKTFSTIVTSISSEQILDLYEEVSINEKIALLYELLETKKEILFTEIIVRPDSIMDIVCAFLAVLELAKQRKIRLFQNRMFGDIRILSMEQGVEDHAG